jgi:hypothetical protein
LKKTVVPDKRADGLSERVPDDRLRERDAGPITEDHVVERGWSHNVLYNEALWLWVPAFAGTTARH